MCELRDRLPECVGWVAERERKAEGSQPTINDREYGMETVRG